MQTQLGNKWFKLATIAYFGLLVLSFSILSVPPGKLGIYITMGILALAACLFGKSFLRMLAILLVVLAVILSVIEYNRGQELQQKLHEIRNSAN